jgi:cytoskeleton protein RodZ
VTDDLVPQPPFEAGASGSPSPSGPTPGAALAAARQQAGLSVEEVSATTRIRSTLVRAIEHDEYERCGGEVYARGHIRSIAHAVGTDAEPLLADFDRRYGNPAPTATVAPISTLGEPVREVTRTASRTTPKWPTAAIAVLALIVVLLLVSWVVGRQDPRGPTSAAPPSPAPSATESRPGTPSPSPGAATTAPTVGLPTTGVVVRLQVSTDSSWVRVTSASGVQIYEGILTAGQSKEFHDPSALTFRFGNSGAVSLEFNGRLVGRPCSTQVCSQQYRATGAV